MGIFSGLWSDDKPKEKKEEKELDYIRLTKDIPDNVRYGLADQIRIVNTFGTDVLDSIFKQYAPVIQSDLYYIGKQVSCLEKYAELNEMKGRITELQKRCIDKQTEIIKNLTKNNDEYNAITR